MDGRGLEGGREGVGKVLEENFESQYTIAMMAVSPLPSPAPTVSTPAESRRVTQRNYAKGLESPVLPTVSTGYIVQWTPWRGQGTLGVNG